MVLPAGAVDPLFLSQHGECGFQPMDSCSVHIALLEQGFVTDEHGIAHDPDDIQHSISNAR